jgi:hypothetical protein
VVTGLSSPKEIVVDSTQVYWSDSTDGTINAMPKAGGAITHLARDQAGSRSLVLDDSYIYWCNYLGGAVMRAAKDGKSAAEIVSAATSPQSVVLDPSHVYFYAAGGIWKASKTPGSMATPFITTLEVSFMASDSATTIWVFGIGPNFGFHAGTYSIDLATAAVTAHGQRGFWAKAMASRGSEVAGIWFDSFGDSIEAFGVPGARLENSYGAAGSILSIAPCGFLWVGTSAPAPGIYLSGFGSVAGAPLTTGPANGVAADDDALYWTDPSGAIGRLPL